METNSYNHNFRKMYAGKGYIYDFDKNKFLHPQPFASWSLDSNDDWKAPITHPTVTDDGSADEEDPNVWYYRIRWDEAAYNATQKVGKQLNQTIQRRLQQYDWDASGLAWVSA